MSGEDGDCEGCVGLEWQVDDLSGADVDEVAGGTEDRDLVRDDVRCDHDSGGVGAEEPVIEQGARESGWCWFRWCGREIHGGQVGEDRVMQTCAPARGGFDESRNSNVAVSGCDCVC